MPEAYSKPCQIYKMMRHIENPGIVRRIYSGIFNHIQGYSTLFSHGQPYWGTISYIEEYSGIIEIYWAIFRHIQNYDTFRTRGIFKSLSNSKAYLILKIKKINALILKKKSYITYSGIFRHIRAYSALLRHFHAYSAMLFRDIQYLL